MAGSPLRGVSAPVKRKGCLHGVVAWCQNLRKVGRTSTQEFPRTGVKSSSVVMRQSSSPQRWSPSRSQSVSAWQQVLKSKADELWS